MKLGRYKVLAVIIYTDAIPKVNIYFYNNHTRLFGLTYYLADAPFLMTYLGDYINGSLRFYMKSEKTTKFSKMSGDITIDNLIVIKAIKEIEELTWYIGFPSFDDTINAGKRIYYSTIIIEYLKQNLKLYGRKERIFEENAQSVIQKKPIVDSIE